MTGEQSGRQRKTLVFALTVPACHIFKGQSYGRQFERLHRSLADLMPNHLFRQRSDM
jgi:hypothetical protein